MREIRLLGTPKITDPAGPVPRFRSQLTVALLGYLAVERRLITRERLAAFFWPDDALSAGKGKLRRELHNLNQILPGCWEIDRLTVRFLPNQETFLDLDELQDLEETGAWREAADLLHGEFLEGITLDDNLEFETWLLGEQERWRQRGILILSVLQEELVKQNLPQEALRYGRRLLRLAPWDELAHERNMRLLAQSGQPLAALKQFEEYRQYVTRELGVEPATKMLELKRSIEAAIIAPSNNLPFPDTDLIGREKELAEIANLLARDNGRLITLIGPGGIGKTKLAIEAAHRYYRQTNKSVAFVPLQGVGSANGLVRAFAKATGMQFSGHLDPVEQLLLFLRSRQVLLLVDNFEHLLEQAALLSRIITAAPQVRLLITSRERLNLHAETVFIVPGLEIDCKDDGGQTPAEALFIDTARHLQPFYQPTEKELEDIRKIGRLVEGMPLALELAARWTNMMTTGQILVELQKGLDILFNQASDLPPRHLSITAVFEHSWKMLTDQEQQTLSSLSVFAGEFDLEAAAVVGNASFKLLQNLHDKSLLSAIGNGRFRLHELLCQFAAIKLANEESRQQQALERHCHYYAALLRSFEIESRHDLQSIANSLLRISEEFNNAQKAWQYALENYLLSQVFDFTFSLNLYFEFQSEFQTGKAFFEAAIQRLQSTTMEIPPIVILRLLAHYGWMCEDVGEHEIARQSLEKALSLSSDLAENHSADLCILHFFYGWMLHRQGHSTTGISHMMQGQASSRSVGYDFGFILCTTAMSDIFCDLGDYAAAREILADLPPDIGPFLTPLKLSPQAVAEAAMGDFNSASDSIQQMIDLLYDLPFVSSMLYIFTCIAALLGFKGNQKSAVALLNSQLKHPKIGGYALRRNRNLTNKFRMMLSSDEYPLVSENNEEYLDPELPIPGDFDPNIETINYLNDLLRAVNDSKTIQDLSQITGP
ncbi:MAG: BTAD domain-containing putative transcriptional regulator [Candidatus Promineifilaceae bacterium]